MLCGPVGAFIIVHHLSAEKQGIYYLFISLIALRSFFELGVTAAISQIAAHARTGSGAANGHGEDLEPSFVIVVNRWMARAAVLYGLLGGLAGIGFLVWRGLGSFDVLSSWTVAIGVASLQLSQEGRMGVLYGLDKVEEANTLRFRLSLLQYGSQWLMLFLGLGLLSFGLSSLASYLCEIAYFKRIHAWLWVDQKSGLVDQVERYRTELKNLMKRVSQTYMTGYLVMQIQIPLSVYLFGAVGASKYGFTQTVGNSLIGMAGVWISAAFPAISYSISRGRVDEAKAHYLRRGRQALVVAIACSLATGLAYWVLTHFDRFAERLMPPAEAAILFFGMFLQQVALSLLFWPRSFKVEPFVHVAYTQMILTPVLLFWLGRTNGLLGFSMANVASWMVGLSLIIPVVLKFWRKNDPTHPPRQFSSGSFP